MSEEFIKTKRCYLIEIDDQTEETVVEFEQDCGATDRKGYPFGSRSFVNTRKCFDAIVNGKYINLPFGLKLIKTK